jgi:multicomponent Na+:H+ antiporter subunit D
MRIAGIVLIAPLILPLLTAIAGLLALAIKPLSRRLQNLISSIGGVALLLSAMVLFFDVLKEGILVVQIGSWPMPFGITLVADVFSSIMILISGIIGFTGQIYSMASINPERIRIGYFPLLFTLLLGVNGAFLTGDLFNLYVWFEVMLMSSFVLMSIGRNPGQTSGAIKYVTINLFSSAIFLTALGILYGLIGTLNMADLAVKFSQARQAGESIGLINVVSGMFLIAFGIKAAVFPLFFWLPDSYFAPPPAISAVFAGLLTKVGVYALIRVFTLIFPLNQGSLQQVVLWIAGITMVTGVLGAVAQNEVRRILSFHIISQIGYMVMGLALYTPLAIAGSVFYIFHHVMVKTNLFFAGGLMERIGGTGDLKRLGGLYQNWPVLSVLFLIPALSLAGLPPLSGFFAKLSLLQAGFEIESFWIVGVALFVSLLTLFSMTKIWTQAFWKPAPEIEDLECVDRLLSQHEDVRAKKGQWYIPIILLAVITLLVGFGAGFVFPIAVQAGEQLINPAGYIEAVFRSGG